MKLLVSLFAVMLLTGATAQTQNQNPAQTQVQLFAQCLFDIPTQQEMLQLETDLKASPYTHMVRLDWNTQRALIITQGLTSLNESDFTSWFGQYSGSVHCIQIGVYGIDQMNQYPFNCQNN
jgi:hypothetical protein